jgi:hypothetical protein
VPDDAYRAGRADVLSRFAARPVIFPDAAFALACEKKARDNLAREIASTVGGNERSITPSRCAGVVEGMIATSFSFVIASEAKQSISAVC